MTLVDPHAQSTPVSDVEAVPTRHARRRLRPWPVVALVVAVFLAAAAAGFYASSASAHHDAVAGRRRARAAEHAAVGALAEARDDLSTTKDVARRVLDPAQPILGAFQSLADLGAQSVAQASVTQALGADPSSSVDAYNDSVDHSNALTDRFNQTVSDLDRQIRGALGAPGSSVA